MPAYTFNWQEHEDPFWDWATIVIQGPDSLPQDKFDELSEATDHFTNIKITVQMNGIEMDPKYLFERLEGDFDRQVAVAVAEKIEEADLTPLYDVLTDVTDAVKVEVRKRFEAVGITLPEEDRY